MTGYRMAILISSQGRYNHFDTAAYRMLNKSVLVIITGGGRKIKHTNAAIPPLGKIFSRAATNVPFFSSYRYRTEAR